ncbi:hypothetical protein AYO38_11370 [bacterium SCGC AG-212-C10]|nr:hypothetical protein AYO38_11370 [bacterium SCGC AG-212-C10]
MTAAEGHFQPGDVVALRYVMRTGQPGMSWPARVVLDTDELVAIYIPRGSTYMRWDNANGTRQLAPANWRRDMLRLMYPGEGHSIWAFWEYNDAGERVFGSYYVNMEEPFRRSPIGFDTNDHTLDVIVRPDLSWEWKDKDELEERVAGGIFPREFADQLLDGASSVIARLEARQSPFCDGWDRWTPDPDWDIPSLPGNWREEPATLWPGRHAAYLSTR